MPNPLVLLATTAAAAVGSSAIKAKSAKDAANAQVEATNKAAQLQADQLAQQRADQDPFRQAGIASTNELQRRLGLSGDATSAGYGSLGRDFSQQDFQADPGYAFRLSEGLKGIDRQAAARGGLISGGALKAAERYGQNLASDEYQNAFARYNQNRQLNYNMLSGQQGVGQAATNAMGAASQNYANTTGDYYLGAGNARASGYIGQGNAYSSGINSLAKLGGNYYDTKYGPQG
jgi:hypothetical protein